MLRPQQAVIAVPNRETILKELENYTDQILALELTTDTDGAIEIVYNGERYHMMKRFVRQFITLYKGFYEVTDKTNARKYVYILEFRAIGL